MEIQTSEGMVPLYRLIKEMRRFGLNAASGDLGTGIDTTGVTVAGTPVGAWPTNVGLAASADAGALTIALKGANGQDPSDTNPVYLPFRNANLLTGTPEWLTVTTPQSLVISSGSTLAVQSSTAFRLWVVGFNDGGTFRLGVIQLNAGTSSTNIWLRGLDASGVVSSVAEGGAGGADGSWTFYTATAVSSKAYCILGFLEWSPSGLTAGTWTTDNLLRVQVFGPGVPLPGQTRQASGWSGTGVDSTTSSTPQNSGLYVSAFLLSAANYVRWSYSGTITMIADTQSGKTQMYRGATAIGTPAFAQVNAGSAIVAPVAETGIDFPNTTSQVDYRVLFNNSDNTSTVSFRQGSILIQEIMG